MNIKDQLPKANELKNFVDLQISISKSSDKAIHLVKEFNRTAKIVQDAMEEMQPKPIKDINTR